MLRITVCILLAFLLFSRSLAHEVLGDDPCSGHPPSENSNHKNCSDKNEFFSAYKPNYILGSSSGGKNSSEDIKFQISFKQQLILSEKESNEAPDKYWLNKFYFGYTQRSFWDIGRESAPFRDSVFSPELFYEETFESDDGSKPAKRMQFGLVHASNGRDGNDSRSWNRAYAEFVYSYWDELGESWFGKKSRHGFKDTPKISAAATAWYIIDAGDENKDIEDYLGYGQASFKYSTKGEQINLSGWYGKKDKLSIEANLIIKAIPWLDEVPFFPSTDNTYFWQIQYFDGYGDELLEYDRRQTVARVGLLFTY